MERANPTAGADLMKARLANPGFENEKLTTVLYPVSKVEANVVT